MDRKAIKNRIVYLLIIAVTVGLDQLTKWLAVVYLKPVGDLPLWQDVLHLTYLENTGAAFGMLKDQRWVFMVFSTVAILALLVAVMVYKKLSVTEGILLSMIIGGGIGNMIDRIAQGYVVDFINFELIDFAIFNGADSFVCVGGVLLVLYILITDIKAEKAKKRAAAAEDGQA